MTELGCGMNLQRLQDVLGDIKEELEATQVEPLLQNMESALQQLSSQPNQPQFQEQFNSHLMQLRDALERAPSRSQGPAWFHDVDELHLRDLTAAAMESRVDSVLKQINLMPNIAVQGFNKLRNEIAAKRQQTNSILDGLRALNVEHREVPAGKAEIIVVIPRIAVDNNLDKFANEAKSIDRLIKTVAEAVTGQRDDVEIQSLSTSELTLGLLVVSVAALNFSRAVGILVAAWERVARIYGFGAGLKAEGLPKEVLDVIDKHAVTAVKAQVEYAADEIIKTGRAPKQQRDKERENELRNHLVKELEGLARRIRRGYQFDVKPSDEAPSEDEPAEKKIFDEIKKLRSTLQILSIEGQQLLELPAGDGQGDEEPPQVVA